MPNHRDELPAKFDSLERWRVRAIAVFLLMITVAFVYDLTNPTPLDFGTFVTLTGGLLALVRAGSVVRLISSGDEDDR